MSKPGDKPPAGTAGQWEELTLESTRTLKARVLVPAKPGASAKTPVAQAAAPAPAALVEETAARADALNELFTLESTITTNARVLPSGAAQAAAVEVKAPPAAPPAEPPRRPRLTTNELHALSIKIKAEREKAELDQLKAAAPRPPKK